jgi:hypothetical protein
MNGLRIEIRVPCCCDEGGHGATAFRTATDGLVVAQWVHRRGREGRWSILHHTTGCSLPYDFGDPESAMACAQALSAHGEWVGAEPTYDQLDVEATLMSFGGEATAGARGPRSALNGASA